MSKKKPTTTQLVPVAPIATSGFTPQDLEELLSGNLPPSWDVQRLPESSNRNQLGKLLASGGMGSLYQATDCVLGRKVAIKVLQLQRCEDQVAVLRFLQEARIHGQLQHPGIPPLHDLARFPDGRPFIAMGYIRGRTLSESHKEHRQESLRSRCSRNTCWPSSRRARRWRTHTAKASSTAT